MTTLFTRVYAKLYRNPGQSSESELNSNSVVQNVTKRQESRQRKIVKPNSSLDLNTEQGLLENVQTQAESEERSKDSWEQFFGKLTLCIISLVFDQARSTRVLPYSTLPIKDDELAEDLSDYTELYLDKRTRPTSRDRLEFYMTAGMGCGWAWTVVQEFNLRANEYFYGHSGLNVEGEDSGKVFLLHVTYFVTAIVIGSHWLITVKNPERMVVLVNQVLWLAINFKEVSTCGPMRRFWLTVILFVHFLTLFSGMMVWVTFALVIEDPGRFSHGFRYILWAFELEQQRWHVWFWAAFESYVLFHCLINALMGLFVLAVFSVQSGVVMNRPD